MESVKVADGNGAALGRLGIHGKQSIAGYLLHGLDEIRSQDQVVGLEGFQRPKQGDDEHDEKNQQKEVEHPLDLAVGCGFQFLHQDLIADIIGDDLGLALDDALSQQIVETLVDLVFGEYSEFDQVLDGIDAVDVFQDVRFGLGDADFIAFAGLLIWAWAGTRFYRWGSAL
jgi:hypothetical protein